MLNWIFPRVFHGFGQANGKPPIYTTSPATYKTMLDLKVVKIDSKIIISLH